MACVSSRVDRRAAFGCERALQHRLGGLSVRLLNESHICGTWLVVLSLAPSPLPVVPPRHPCSWRPAYCQSSISLDRPMIKLWIHGTAHCLQRSTSAIRFVSHRDYRSWLAGAGGVAVGSGSCCVPESRRMCDHSPPSHHITSHHTLPIPRWH